MLINRIPKVSNRLKIALRNTANAIGNLKIPLFPISKMIVEGVPYQSEDDYEFLDQKRKRKVRK